MNTAPERVRLNLVDALSQDPRTDVEISAAAWGDLEPRTRETRLARMKRAEGLTLANLDAVAAALGIDWSELCQPRPEPPKLTPKRRGVLDTLESSGATEASPLRLHGTSHAAAVWLHEHGLAGMSEDGFWPC